MGLYEIQNEINRLPLAEQATLLDKLWLKLNPEEILTRAQKVELDKRYQEFLAGEQETFAAEEVHEKLRKKYL